MFLHCLRIRVLGFRGNSEMVVMAVKGLAGESECVVNAIALH